VRIATTGDANRAGAYPITVSDARDTDYAITFVNATLTVRPAIPPSELPYRYYMPFVIK
jgi:hypothetical protein